MILPWLLIPFALLVSLVMAIALAAFEDRLPVWRAVASCAFFWALVLGAAEVLLQVTS